MHNKIVRLLALCAAVFMYACSLSTSAFAASSETLYGDVLMAVNTNLSSDSVSAGSFSSEAEVLMSEHDIEDSLPDFGIFNVYTDPDTGKEMTVLQPNIRLPAPVEDQTEKSLLAATAAENASYNINDTKTLLTKDNTTNEMKCLYVGTYCTVWSCPGDDDTIEITSSIAKEIGEEFDSYYPDMISAFGNYYDVDGDGKLAIMCYDIDSQYPNTVNEYIAGYFYAYNLADSNGYINGIWYNTSNSSPTDCIHLDTYPGMGSYYAPLTNVSRSYSTLVHEFQHLINFSYQIAGGTHSSYISSMDVYLDEAFAMAAEHMICGSDSTSSRIEYFNNPSKYSPGSPLTYWTGSLSGYSNSYLFGQYIRTRYGQMTNTNGNELFKTVLQSRTVSNADETLTIIADLLDTTPEDLVVDFWKAVYYKKCSGNYGFAGEAWADTISPHIYSTPDNGGKNVYNGGVKYYSLGDSGFTPTTVSNLSLIALMPPNIQVIQTSNGKTQIDAFTTKPSHAVVSRYRDKKFVSAEFTQISEGHNSIAFDTPNSNETVKIMILANNSWVPISDVYILDN